MDKTTMKEFDDMLGEYVQRLIDADHDEVEIIPGDTVALMGIALQLRRMNNLIESIRKETKIRQGKEE